MNKLKKILLIVFGIFIFLGILNIGINVWVKAKLPHLINNENNTDYHIAYEAVDLSLWQSKITVHNVVVTPKTDLEKTTKKIGLHGVIKLIEVNDIAIWNILFGKKIKAKNLIISKPTIILYKNNANAINDYNTINSKVIKPFENIILVSDLYINKGQLKIFNNENEKTIASVHNINFNLEGIVINEKTLNEKIPLLYEDYSFSCDSVFYRMNEFYEIKTSAILTSKEGVSLKKFKLLPLYSREKFVQKIPKEKDLFTILTDEISLHKMNWGFKDGVFFFHTNSVLLNKINANIYRGKMPVDDVSKKELYSKLLRDIKADIRVDTLVLKNSFLTYEEEKTFEKGSGKLFFSNFNMLVHNLESGYNKAKLPDVQIKINCDFMKKSPLKVNWSFNVLDKTDGFNIAGTIYKFDTEELEAFTKPYMNIKVKGIFDEIRFNFTGNDVANKGTFSLKYDDVKVEIYQNDKRLKKNKFLTAIGNLFVKEDSDGTIKTAAIEVERNPEKSFYNLLWISLADGLKQVLL
jgi:hypothetical protein